MPDLVRGVGNTTEEKSDKIPVLSKKINEIVISGEENTFAR